VLVQARLGLKCADHVFCVSNQDRDYLTRRLGIPGERITRIYSAADPAYATIAGRRDYARGDRLVFFGTWIARKGTRDLVEAFTALAARYHTMTLTVLGSGMPRATVVEAFPAHVRSKVLWTDASSAPAMAEVLASTDIYVLPSLFEGTPLTLVEAMMTGVPSICTDTSGMHDVIEHGRNGLLVPLRSPASLVGAVERLRNDDRLRERLGRAAHVDARDRYTWPRVARPVREAYERLADSRRRRVLDVRGAS
jgi:glycosyltransferase involved in cell wall biosynthesis